MKTLRLPSRKTAAMTAAILALAYLIYLLGSWLLLPRILQSQSEQFIAEKTGHRLTMDRPEVNPFNLSLRLHNLRLTEPDGKQLLAFKELLIDLSATSIMRRAWVFDAIRLEGLEASIVELPGDKLNWGALLESLQSRQTSTQPASPLPRLEITQLIVSSGGIDLADYRSSPGFSARIQPLDLHLDELSTLPDDKGRYQLSALTDFGAKVLWQGDVTLNPLALSGHFDVEDVSLARLASLIKQPLRMTAPEGTAGLSANYRLSETGGQIDLVFDQIEARLAGLKVHTQIDKAPLLSLDGIALKGGRFDMRQRNVTVATIAVMGGGINLSRNQEGRLNLLDLLPVPEGKPSTAQQRSTTATPLASTAWHYRVDRIAMSGVRADFRDLTVAPEAQLALKDIALEVDNVSDVLSTPWPVRASFNADSGGRFESEGTLVAAKPSVDLHLKLTDFSLKPAQPYLSAVTTLTLQSGALSSEGRAHYDSGDTGFSGSVAVNNLRLKEAGVNTDFMTWKSLVASKLDATPTALQIGDLALTGLDTQLIIAKDKSVNLSRVVRPRTAPNPPATKPAAPGNVPPPPYRVDIDRLRVAGSEMEYADYSLALPFGTRIHHLHGAINGLSSRPGAPGQIELAGQVNDYGSARAAGQINLFDPTDFMDLKVIFRNIEMTRLTPYSATFAGRKIQSGKLSLDLDYKIKQRQLSGDNKVVMDQLVLGERVQSPQAKDLPLDLAIALLQDSEGRIDLGLPVSGSLDDPQFSFGGLVWKVIENVLTKVATSPFRALGALFGGGEQVLDHIAFEAGRARLAPPEREKLVKLAATLGKRPALALAVHGTYADVDRVALQDLQLRYAVAGKMGYQIDAQHDPGPISTGQPKVQSVLEDLFVDHFGRGELAALKDGFRKANPGQLEESGAGKLLSRMTTVFSDKHDLPESDIAKLKNADFYAVLYQRLRDKEVVADERLQALAKARGEAALAELKAANAPAERITLLAPQKTDAAGNDVPLGIDATVANKKQAA